MKQRIRAIKNIGKITKAMKMVAASKMRNAQTAVEHSRGIVEPFVRLFGDYPGMRAVQRLWSGGRRPRMSVRVVGAATDTAGAAELGFEQQKPAQCS